MVQKIDFLPSQYWQTRQRRRKKVWRQAVLALFLSIIVVGTFRQRQTRVSLESERDRVQLQANQLMSQLGNPDELKQQIDELGGRAMLVAQLCLQARQTPLLAAIAQSRPDYVSLTELRTSYNPISRSTARKPVSPPTSASPTAAPQKRPEQIDLKSLLASRNENRMIVDVLGIAPDNVAISRFLAALESTRLFRNVELIDTNRLAYRNEYQLRSFEIRLHVRSPGERTGTAPGTTAAARVPLTTTGRPVALHRGTPAAR